MTYRVIDTKTDKDVTSKEDWHVTPDGKLYYWDDCYGTLEKAPESYVTILEKYPSPREQNEMFQFLYIKENSKGLFVYSQKHNSKEEAVKSVMKQLNCAESDILVRSMFIDVSGGREELKENNLEGLYAPVWVVSLTNTAALKLTFTEKAIRVNGWDNYCVSKIKFDYIQARELAAFAWGCDEHDLVAFDRDECMEYEDGRWTLGTSNTPEDVRCPVWRFRKKD